jgi:predicted kinase
MLKYMEFRYDEGRLQRSRDVIILSIDTDGEEMPEGHYLAISGSQPHYCITLPYMDCDCNDFAWGTDRLCKHLIAALRYEKNASILQADDSAVESVTLETTLVCGPPASGKSSYVKDNAQRGDLVWDLDEMVRTLTHGLEPHEISVTTREIVRKMRTVVMEEIAKASRNPKNELERAWVIWSLPKVKVRRAMSDQLKADVIVFECPVEQCVENAQKDDRPGAFLARVRRDSMKWWDMYSRSDKDQIIAWEGHSE